MLFRPVMEKYLIKAALFDLDDTLYPMASGINEMMGERIQLFVMRAHGLTYEAAVEKRHYYRNKYGTALRGLDAEHGSFDREGFLAYVHDLPIEEKLAARPEVRVMLEGLGLRKAVFTNSNIEHARRVLQHLNLSDCFEAIYDIRWLDGVNKPHPDAFHKVCDAMGVKPGECILVEDSIANSRAAKALGMTTILVDQPPSHAADWFITDVASVGEIVRTFIQPA